MTHLRLVVVGRYELFVLKRVADVTSSDDAADAGDDDADDDARYEEQLVGAPRMAVTHRAHLERVGFVGHPDDAADPHVFIVLCSAARHKALRAQLVRGGFDAGGFDDFDDDDDGAAAWRTRRETHDAPFELAFRDEELDRALEVCGATPSSERAAAHPDRGLRRSH